MKITEVIKECRARDTWLWDPVSGYKDAFSHGKGFAYGECADMLEETTREIREELNRVMADSKDKDLNNRTSAGAMAVLRWILGEEDET